mmetsp:Transcript_12235/g.18536  ORF Transcript_12235/g.18536 Transcript_12235/m.18536 type:complete len:83 (-) Transcript_12235:339-587(-)
MLSYAACMLTNWEVFRLQVAIVELHTALVGRSGREVGSKQASKQANKQASERARKRPSKCCDMAAASCDSGRFRVTSTSWEG